MSGMLMILLLMVSMIQGVTLRGTVRQPDDKPIADANVTLVGPDGTLNTTSTQDGTFTFKLSRPGNVQLTASRAKFTGQPTTIYAGQDMDAIGIVLRPMVNPFVLGSIRVEGDQPLPE